MKGTFILKTVKSFQAILKWIYEGRLSIETELIGFIKKGYQAILQFHEPGIFENKTVEEIFRLLFTRADANLKLSHSDYLNKWSSGDEAKMHKLLYEFTEKSRQLLLDNGYIHHVKRKTFMFSYGDYEFAQSGEQLRDDIYKFINDLYDYSLLNEQEAVNVKL